MLALGGGAVAALFLGALVERTPAPPFHVAVIAEPFADPGRAPYVVRLSAVDAASHRTLRVNGAARVGDVSARIEDGIGRVAVHEGAARLELDLVVDGEPLALECALAPRAPAPQARFERAPAERAPVIGMRTRSVSLTLDGELARVTLRTPSRELLAVDLLIDGVWRDVRVVEVDGEAPVTFALPPDVGEGALVVVHVAEPWPLSRGAWAAATFGAGAVVSPDARPAVLRPPPLACAPPAKVTDHAWRTAFEVAGGLFVIALVGSLWFDARAEPRRGAALALVAGVVLAAFLLGLDVMLRLGAPGAP